MADVAIPLGLTVSYESATSEEEDAVFPRDHNGWAVVRLNGTAVVARLPLGFVKWSDCGLTPPSSDLVEAVAEWLTGLGTGT